MELGQRYTIKQGLLIAIVFIVGLSLGIAMNYNNSSSDSYYQCLLQQVYNRYSVAMRDMEASSDLIQMNYYYQHLSYEDKMRWIMEKPNPSFYANDAMDQMDRMAKLLTTVDWPDSYKSKISQLKTYLNELRQLVVQIQEIANKTSYTENDVNTANSILDVFHSYNNKIYNIVSQS